MKSLKTLIKLYKKRLDDKRLELRAEEETLEELNKIIERIQREMREEKVIAGKSVEGSYTYPGYLEKALDTEKKILNLIAMQEKKIEKIRDEMAEEFSELKKYEIMLDVKQKAFQKEADRVEQVGLDEIATNNFLREMREG